MAKRKPTTCTVSLWNVTGSISITSHADEAHKSINLVDFNVKLGDTDTVGDLLNGVGNILELNEWERDFLRHLVLKNREAFSQMAREHFAKEVMA